MSWSRQALPNQALPEPGIAEPGIAKWEVGYLEALGATL